MSLPLPFSMPSKPSHTSVALAGGVSGAILWGVYFLYTVNAGLREAVAGAISAGIATAGAIVFARQSGCRYYLRLRDLAEGWRVPINAVAGTGQALRALGLQLFTAGGAPSLQKSAPFDMGMADDPAAAGRRALAVFYTTMTSNSVVVGLFPDEHRIVVHQIIPAELSPMTKHLGAEA